MNRLLLLSKCVLLGVWIVGTPACQGQTTAPASTKPGPTSLPISPQERAIINAANNAPADKPAPRIDISVYLKDGTRNPNFGKPHPGFMAAHESFLKRREKPVGLLFIGDSITAGWAIGGKRVWEANYAKYDAADFGINGERTDYVLWRFEQGELDGIHPKVVVLMIGTNNYSSRPAQVVEGIQAILTQLHTRLPETKVLLLGIFPRGQFAKDATGQPDLGRAKLMAINQELAKLADGQRVRYLDLWKLFLGPDDSLSADIMPDYLHPSEKGYQIWADAMRPVLDEMMK